MCFFVEIHTESHSMVRTGRIWQNNHRTLREEHSANQHLIGVQNRHVAAEERRHVCVLDVPTLRVFCLSHLGLNGCSFIFLASLRLWHYCWEVVVVIAKNKKTLKVLCVCVFSFDLMNLDEKPCGMKCQCNNVVDHELHCWL